jgi:hypothetical protein
MSHRDTPRGSLIGGLAGLALLIAAPPLSVHHELISSYLATGGFLILSVSAYAARYKAGAGIALAFAVYGGVSAMIAVGSANDAMGTFDPGLADLRSLGVVTSYVHPPAPGAESFRYAMFATCLGGAAAVLAACAVARRTREERPPAPSLDAGLAERAGRVLVLIGFCGFALAAVRYAFTDHSGQTIWESLKSLWTGGSYTLLIALAAVPGAGFWLHGLLSRRRGPHELAWFAATIGFFALLSLGTGQRGFLIDLTLVCLVVVAWHRGLTKVQFAALGATAILALAITQAIRNSVRETGSVSPSGVVERLGPDRWRVLVGSQFSSFQYTWETAYYRHQLDIPNTFLALFEKPVPRQLLPGKVQGFGDEFTSELYPDAHDQQIAFATPLVAESDYSFGLVGVALVLGLVGALAALAETRVLGRAPPELQPVLITALIWSCFVLVRGDLANAAFVISGWLLPTAAVCAAIGFLPFRESAAARATSGYARRFFEGVDARAVPVARAADGWLSTRMREVRATNWRAMQPNWRAMQPNWRAMQPSNPALIALALLLTIVSAYVLYLGRDFTFFRDDYLILFYRDGRDLGNYLATYAGNLFPFTIAVYLALAKTVGLDHYWAFRIVGLVGHLAVVLALYMLCRRRIGDVAALAPAIVIAFLGSGWANILFPEEITFTAALACGLWALLALDRGDLLGDIGVCALLVIGLGWGSPILPFIAAVALGLWLRGRLWSRLWVVAVPTGIYLAWLAAYQTDDLHSTYDPSMVLDFAARMGGAAFAGPTGLPSSWGIPLVIAVLALLVVRLARMGRSAVLGWEGLTIILTVGLVTGIARAHENLPTSSRYVYLGVVILLVALVGAMPARPPGRVGTAVLIAAALLTLIPGVRALDRGRDEMIEGSEMARVQLGAIEIAGDSISPDYEVVVTDVPVPGDVYLGVVERYGSSPADTPDELAARPEAVREKVDLALVGALRPSLWETGRPPFADETCVTRSGSVSQIALKVPRRGIWMRPEQPVQLQVSLRRFGSRFTQDLAPVPAGVGALLRFPVDQAPNRPWFARIRSPEGGFRVCSAGG